MTPQTRMIFALGARLGLPITTVEAMSMREVLGWVEFFNARARAEAANDEEALPLASLTRDELRAMFRHGRD